MKNGTVLKSAMPESGDMELINAYSRRPLKSDEVYTFSVTLCDNETDRDCERFSDEALYGLCALFVGKTGICDHEPSAKNQKARIYDCYVDSPAGEKTADGRDYKRLCAKAYMLRIPENEALINEIDAGIKKEVSVGCRMGKAICSVCGKSRTAGCEHRTGKSYNGKICHTVLCEPIDAYEWSFVAVPAQKKAGVNKSFKEKEKHIMTCEEILKSLDGGNEILLSGEEAASLKEYVGKLRTMASVGENYVAEKRAAVLRHITEKAAAVPEETVRNIVNGMALSQLDELYKAFKNQNVQAQLAHRSNTKEKNSGFMI